MYLVYDESNGRLYAKVFISHRGKDGAKDYKECKTLGRVLDKERGIYRNRKHGVYCFDIKTGSISPPPEDFVEPQEVMRRNRSSLNEKDNLILGPVHLLHGFVKQQGLNKVIDAIRYGNMDSVYSLLYYYIISNRSNDNAEIWYQTSAAKIFFPNACLNSQRISDMLSSIGAEVRLQAFFKDYLRYLSSGDVDISSILIDSTGLPNSIHFPLTAISNHNGEISNECRLIYVIQQETGLPIYFRYCPGNIVDVTTLLVTLEELKAQHVNTKFAIFDAGYWSSENVKTLLDNKISMLTRLNENLALYKDLVREHKCSLETKENLVTYNGRILFIKCVPSEVFGHKVYLYLARDMSRKGIEDNSLAKRAVSKGMSADEIYDSIDNSGYFALMSTRRIAADKILPLYYSRQQIEQIFDVGKNYVSLTPLRIHNEETLRGHLLITFIATIIVKKLMEVFRGTSYTIDKALMWLNSHQCRVFDEVAVVNEMTKNVKEIYRLIQVTVPKTMPLRSSCA